MEFREEINSSTRNIITAYGDGGFRLVEEKVAGSLCVSNRHKEQIKADSLESVDLETFEDFLKTVSGEIDVFLIGCGPQMKPVPTALQNLLMKYRISFDPMDTGAACRTYNVLIQEERRAGCLLIAV